MSNIKMRAFRFAAASRPNFSAMLYSANVIITNITYSPVSFALLEDLRYFFLISGCTYLKISNGINILIASNL